MSEPTGTLADALLKANVSELLCVTQDDVHLRSSSGQTMSGADIPAKSTIEIDTPTVRAQLQRAHPLIDRWVSRKMSISATLELMLEYTTRLIRIIHNHQPVFALLETGSPHHLFSYCLDIALQYNSIPVYYLYGNVFDGRCVVFLGNEKHAHFSSSSYSAEPSIASYVDEVQGRARYTPADSIKSLAPARHQWLTFALLLKLRQTASRFVRSLRDPSHDFSSNIIALRLPRIGLLETLQILRAHEAYQRLLGSDSQFDLSQVRPDDIVYVGHMLPESTSFPECPDYPGEADILIDLRNRFPDTTLYYREHPAISLYSEYGHIHLQGLHKSPSFYRQLQRLGVRIIPQTLHISTIRERECLFVTKTGRVAVENSVLGIPTLVYGYPFYGRDLPLTLHIAELPAKASVHDVKASVNVPDAVQAVKAHLVRMFSGSIANPGIGLGSNGDARPEFEADIVRLVAQLGSQSS